MLAKNAEELSKLAPQPLTADSPGQERRRGRPKGSPLIVSFDDPQVLLRCMACIDLDTGRMPQAPQELVKGSSPGNPSPDLLAWAEKEGVHLIGMKFRPQGSEKSYYASAARGHESVANRQ